MSKNEDTSIPSFSALNLKDEMLKAINEIGYEQPSPIQAATIPVLLAGKDLIGQAQTGTGKTAAFALPLLSNIDVKNKAPQVMVLTPTRELAIQVAEAFQKYSHHLKGVNILPIYGGQSYEIQNRQLRRGTQIIVGTPGRVMDHMRRKTLKLDALKCLVLDEADEMLRMGFIDDVEWVLSETPNQHQIALFSATMPPQIRRIADRFMNKPEHITVKNKTATAPTIHQRVWKVSGLHKLEALTRILEVEEFDGVIIFVRTKNATLELEERLKARGYAAVALNGDIQQSQRERIVNQLKAGKLDILIGTDVVARGLDVERISHVINYDIPSDTESYIHRIGRTGRAGRKGKAILFATPRETRMLRNIERATKQTIETMRLPSTQTINSLRTQRFQDQITETLEKDDNMSEFRSIVEEYQQRHNIPAVEIATALVKMIHKDNSLFLKDEVRPARHNDRDSRGRDNNRGRDRDRGRNNRGRDKENRGDRNDRGRDKDSRGDRNNRSRDKERGERGDRRQPSGERPLRKKIGSDQADKAAKGMSQYRIAVGNDHKVFAKNIVGAIANEADLDSQYIGKITINQDHSIVELPEGMPQETFDHLKSTWISGQQLNITLVNPPHQRKNKKH
ncbi:MAG: DEAD/DEAH box helicase [Thiotrichaceae bacterium]|nr:DEAD/DEAH box helicase [Thiotrichaceae bacterium]